MKKARKQCNKSRPRRSSQSQISSSAVVRMTHRRHFRSSHLEESRPGDIAVRRKRKGTECGPRGGDTFDHLFGSSLSVTGRRILEPNSQRTNPPSSVQAALRTSTFPKVMHGNFYDNVSSVLHRPLELTGRSSNEEEHRSKDGDDDDAADCPAAGAAAGGTTDRFPYLRRGMRASDGSLTMDRPTCPKVAETPLEDLPRDIYWLGDPPPPPPPPLDFLEDHTDHEQPAFEEAPPPSSSSYPAETGQLVSPSSSYGLASAVCWLGDPVVLNAPQPPPPTTDRSCRSRLRSNPFNDLLQTRPPPSSCRIRQLQRNIGSSFL